MAAFRRGRTVPGLSQSRKWRMALPDYNIQARHGVFVDDGSVVGLHVEHALVGLGGCLPHLSDYSVWTAHNQPVVVDHCLIVFVADGAIAQ